MAITKFEIGHGGFAEEALAAAANAYAVPDGMSDADGAGFLIAYLTGWLGLVTRGKMERGEWLAVLGAAGGTGSAAIQIGRALGGRVIAVVGGPEKAEYCRGLGAEYTVDHRDESVGDRLREITGGHGADLVYDPVGGTPAIDSIKGIANEGRLLAVGFASGESTHPSARDVLRPQLLDRRRVHGRVRPRRARRRVRPSRRPGAARGDRRRVVDRRALRRAPGRPRARGPARRDGQGRRRPLKRWNRVLCTANARLAE